MWFLCSNMMTWNEWSKTNSSDCQEVKPSRIWLIWSLKNSMIYLPKDICRELIWFLISFAGSRHQISPENFTAVRLTSSAPWRAKPENRLKCEAKSRRVNLNLSWIEEEQVNAQKQNNSLKFEAKSRRINVNLSWIEKEEFNAQKRDNGPKLEVKKSMN